MGAISNSCPYRVVRKVALPKDVLIEERFDFQIEDGKVSVISLGEFDLVKEVESHKDEVGLINFLKMCQARGLDPETTAAKTEPGLMADVGEINTLDDLLKAKASTDIKLGKIAEQYGLTLDQLTNALKTGDLSFLNKKEDPVEPSGGEE